MWIVHEETIDTTTTQDHCCLPQLKFINLLLKMDGGQVSPSLQIIDYATFALITQLKMRHVCVGMSPI